MTDDDDDGDDRLLCLALDRAEHLRTRRLAPEVAEQHARRAAALADATRMTIADALAQGGELCVCDLSWVVERSENLVSHHVRRLKAAGLVDSRREGKMAFYSLSPAGQSLLATLAVVNEGARA